MLAGAQKWLQHGRQNDREKIIQPWLVYARAVFVFALGEIAVELVVWHLHSQVDGVGLLLQIIVHLLFILPFLFFFVLLPMRRRFYGKLHQQELLHLSRRLLTSVEQERKQLAQDLHDDFGQTLTALQLGIETLKTSCVTEARHRQDCIRRCDSLAHMVARLGDKVRSVCAGLRPVALDGLGLAEALRTLVCEYDEQGGCGCISLRLELNEERYPSLVELAIYRVCQEALTNVRKHARARHTNIELVQQGKNLCLTVADDGRGFDVRRESRLGVRRRSIGLLGIRERVAMLGGAYRLDSRPGRGTTLQVVLPAVPRRKDDHNDSHRTGR